MRGDELCGRVRESPWLVRALGVVRDSGLPDAWIGAGVLRDLVWGQRYGDGFDPSAVRDVDVVFFDPLDLSRANDDRATGRLVAAWPERGTGEAPPRAGRSPHVSCVGHLFQSSANRSAACFSHWA